MHDRRFSTGQGDVDNVDRLAQNNVARQIEENAVIEECGVERGERSVVETGILSQVRLDQLAAVLPGMAETGDLHARRQLAQFGETWCQPAIDQHNLVARTRLGQRTRQVREAWSTFAEMKGNLGKPCQRREPPFLIAQRRKAKFREAVDGVGTQAAHAVVRGGPSFFQSCVVVGKVQVFGVHHVDHEFIRKSRLRAALKRVGGRCL